MAEIINTGEFDRLCILKQPTKSKTDAGAPSNTYNNYCTAWAKRETVSISEEIAGRRISILEKYQYTMYYDSDIKESFRLADSGVEYNILSIDPINRIFMRVLVEKIQT